MKLKDLLKKQKEEFQETPSTPTSYWKQSFENGKNLRRKKK